MITASIGGVMIDEAGLSLHELFSQADTACYMAKELGRNRVHFYSEHDDESGASAQRDGMGQPPALGGRRAPTGAEVPGDVAVAADADDAEARIELLLRFRDERGRLVVPGAFIPAAERYGLMPMIDRWVIETALAHFDQLHPAGNGLQFGRDQSVRRQHRG